MVSIEIFSVKKNLKPAQADASSASAGVPEVVTRLTTCYFLFAMLDVVKEDVLSIRCN